MQSVGDAIRRYKLSTGHFPEEGHETEDEQKRLARVAGVNAYAGFEQYLVGTNPQGATTTSSFDNTAPPAIPGTPETAATGLSIATTAAVSSPPLAATDAPTNVKIKVDLALSAILSESYRRAAPSSWRAEPGTITVFHNTEDYYLIWGAGLDGKPLTREGTDTPLLITTVAR